MTSREYRYHKHIRVLKAIPRNWLKPYCDSWPIAKLSPSENVKIKDEDGQFGYQILLKEHCEFGDNPKKILTVKPTLLAGAVSKTVDYSSGIHPVSDIIIVGEGKNKIWMRKEEAEAIKKLEDDFWTGLLWGVRPPERTDEQKYNDDLKYAYVYAEGKRTMAFVHNKDMKAYRLAEDGYGLKKPREEMPYDYFDRWCTGFDL